MTTPISNDNFSAFQGLKRQDSDATRDPNKAPGAPRGGSGRPAGEDADIGRAHRRLTQESTQPGAPTLGSADEARRRATQIRQMMADSPASAMKAHALVDNDAVEAAMRRPAV